MRWNIYWRRQNILKRHFSVGSNSSEICSYQLRDSTKRKASFYSQKWLFVLHKSLYVLIALTYVLSLKAKCFFHLFLFYSKLWIPCERARMYFFFHFVRFFFFFFSQHSLSGKMKTVWKGENEWNRKRGKTDKGKLKKKFLSKLFCKFQFFCVLHFVSILQTVGFLTFFWLCFPKTERVDLPNVRSK